LLLVFFNPKCGFCSQMAADLSALPLNSDPERPMPILITTGGAEENREFVEQHGIRCVVLLQDEIKVASQYRAQGTPMGYLIDGAGRIASELVAGAQPLLQLAAGGSHHEDHPGEKGNGTARKKYKTDDPSLARSRLNRNGLKAGTPAPEFRLPRLGGGELALADYRGRRLLLVFSDPDCGPCDDLATKLQRMHEDRPELNVLVVSRRDAEATRAKAAKFGLSYPIVMQKQWEISLKYAMFATPIGYLIDEHGIIVRDVAIGVKPILDLADEPEPAFHDGTKAKQGSGLAAAAT
jgi:peroxiredoxin